MHHRQLTTGLAALAIAALVAAGCGDDDTDDATAATDDAPAAEVGAEVPGGGDVGAYCEAVLAVETAPPPELNFETATPEQQATALQAYASETMQPLVAEARAVIPEAMADEGAVMAAAFDEMAATGDFSVFEGPEVTAAEDALHAFDLESCGWARSEVTTTEYAFDGIPAQMEAGVASFDVTNDGQEVHELQLFRKNDGVTATAHELLSLPESEAMSMVSPVGGGAFAPPGDGDYTVVDLDAGDYIAVCFIPTGTTGDDQPPAEDAAPHVAQGMATEFTVG